MKSLWTVFFADQPQDVRVCLAPETTAGLACRCRPCAIQAGLIYRAVKLNVRLFNWDRALDIAQTHKQHLDTVFWYRSRHLATAKQPESNKKYLQLSNEVSPPVTIIHLT
jgi:hypothetical protein